jgi:tetratricopeptide (TPR) repeat protein
VPCWELERGDTAKALRLVDQSIDALQATIKAGKAGVSVLPLYYQRRGLIELQAGRPDAAVADMTKALELFQADMSPGVFSYRIGRAYLFLARALKAQGKEEDARAAARTASEHLQSAAGPDHPDTRSARQLAGLDPSGQ